MKQAVLDGEAEDAPALARHRLDAGLAAVAGLEEGLVKGIEEIGELFARVTVVAPFSPTVLARSSAAFDYLLS